jgi:hypothetical protein
MLSPLCLFGEKPCTVNSPADDINTKVAYFLLTGGNGSLCFAGFLKTCGPSHLYQSVPLDGWFCHAFHVVTSFLVFSFQVNLFLVELVTVTSGTVLFAACKRCYIIEISEHPLLFQMNGVPSPVWVSH